jgi:hypothetical protein
MVTRTIGASTAFQSARSGLGRMACDVMNPADKGHDHTECLRDDLAFVADLQLRLLAAASTGDEDIALDRLSDLMGAIDTER